MEHKKGNPQNKQKAIDFLITQLPVKETEPISQSLCAQEQLPPDDFFSDALDYIVCLPQQEYEELLADIVVTYATPGYEEIVLNVDDKNRLSLIRFIVLINNRIKNEGRTMPLLKFSTDSVETAGGFLLKNGDEIIDCTLEALFKKKKVSIGAEISHILSE